MYEPSIHDCATIYEVLEFLQDSRHTLKKIELDYTTLRKHPEFEGSDITGQLFLSHADFAPFLHLETIICDGQLIFDGENLCTLGRIE